MSSRPVYRTFLSVVLSLCIVVGASAGQITDHLPKDTLGFVAVHDLQSVDAKVTAFMQIFEVPMPSPLTFLKIFTGMGEGIDQQGDLVVAILPADDGGWDFRPLVLLSVTDYAALAESVQADASGEICRVAIGGEDVLIAKKDDFAVLMNVEDRTSLEQLLGQAPKPLDTYARMGNCCKPRMPRSCCCLPGWT